jgi:hypothetical protein
MKAARAMFAPRTDSRKKARKQRQKQAVNAVDRRDEQPLEAFSVYPVPVLGEVLDLVQVGVARLSTGDPPLRQTCLVGIEIEEGDAIPAPPGCRLPLTCRCPPLVRQS